MAAHCESWKPSLSAPCFEWSCVDFEHCCAHTVTLGAVSTSLCKSLPSEVTRVFSGSNCGRGKAMKQQRPELDHDIV